MLKIEEVKALENYSIFVRFDNGKEGVVDLNHLKGKGIFKAWDDLNYFNSVSIDENSGTVTWFGDMDLDSEVLYSKITGQKIEDIFDPNSGKVA